MLLQLMTPYVSGIGLETPNGEFCKCNSSHYTDSKLPMDTVPREHRSSSRRLNGVSCLWFGDLYFILDTSFLPYSSVLCRFDDFLCFQVSGSSDLKNRKSKKILRTTAFGIERMPKARVTETGAVGEPPDCTIRYSTVTMTEQRHLTGDMLDSLLRVLFRDRRGDLCPDHSFLKLTRM